VVGEYQNYGLSHLRRLDVMPGITGLWQIKARREPSFDRYLTLDLEYIENWSMRLDLKILLQTIPVVLRGTGE
jgi:lipopolysaccharide/colanic/teichoic acid biosynthesis glycosyltransferase